MQLTNFVKSPFAILAPAAFMALWAGCIVIRLGLGRYFAILGKRVKLGYYKLYTDAKPESEKTADKKKTNNNNDDASCGGEPFDLAQVSQHVENLFEAPQLFYAACTFLYLLNDRSPVTLGVAWAYVAARLAHSCVALGANNVTHRFLTFGTSMILVNGMMGRVLYLILATE